MKLVFGAMAWLVSFMWLGRHLFVGNAQRSDSMAYALLLGMPSAIAVYALMAWLRPGTAGAARMAPSEPVVIPESNPQSKGEWLMLDVRALPAMLRRWARKEEK